MLTVLGQEPGNRLLTGYFWKTTKNSQQEKQNGPNRKKLVSEKNKKIANPQIDKLPQNFRATRAVVTSLLIFEPTFIHLRPADSQQN